MLKFGVKSDQIPCTCVTPGMVGEVVLDLSSSGNNYALVLGQSSTLILTGVTIYGSHYFRAKFFKKLIKKCILLKIANY
jgi:hypothetical protein